MHLLFILIIMPFSIIFSYNLDIKYALIYSDPLKHSSNKMQNKTSYFGYSVLLMPKFMYNLNNNLDSQLFIGAPRGNYSVLGKTVTEPGITYQCFIPGNCHSISPTSDTSSDIAVNQIGMYAKVIQNHGCFGMSIAAIHPTLLKICAPHTKIELFKPFTNDYIDTMQGICYFYFRSTENSFLQIETESLTTYNFSSPKWYNPLHGFSQNVAVGISPSIKLNLQHKSESIIKSFLKNSHIIVGNPKNYVSGSVNIIQASKRKTLEISNDGTEEAEFGYSVSSGHYFNKSEIMFASGAPVWKFTGKVGIISSRTEELIMFLDGHELGEYFGASLTSCDLNNDGFDDLIVGAPHYGDDNGKVYIYLGSQDEFLAYNPVIEGTVKDAQFGYTLSCGDLDQDGFSDLIIGAPWEESGVIYVYNGYSILGEEYTLEISQRIPAIKISNEFEGFGFSISNLADVDDNGFPDIAIGAYKSGHAVILLSKPVEKTQIDVKVTPTILKRNVLKISPEFCLKDYKALNSQIIKNYTLTVVVDPEHKRFTYRFIVWNIPVSQDTYQVFQYRYSSQQQHSRVTNSHWNGCITSHFNMKSDVHNFIDPVDITFTYELKSYRIEQPKNGSISANFCKICPIKYVGKELKAIKLSVPYEMGCGKDKICDSDISVTTSMYGVGKNNTWEIGSGDISVEVKFQNHGEPAYLVTAEFLIPKGIHLRSILSYCQEENSENSLIVECNIGNPLDKGAQKIIKLDLDMRDFETHKVMNAIQEKLVINITMKSQTNNHGAKLISIPLLLKSNVSFSIIGKTNEDSYYLTSDQQKSANITFQHVYNIFKHGNTPVSEGHLRIDIPTRIDGGESFITLKRPQLQVLGVFYDCVSNDIPLQLHSYTELTNSVKNFNNFNKGKNRNQINITLRKKKRNADKGKIVLEFSDSTQNFQKILKNYTISMDCLNDRVQCGSVVCDLTSLKSPQDIGTIVLSLTIKLESIINIFDIGMIIQFSTEAQINFTKPLKNITEVRRVITSFYNIEEAIKSKQLNIWIILLSLIVGLIIFSMLTSLLYYIGFFEKKQKLELNFLTTDEISEEQEQSTEESNEQEALQKLPPCTENFS